MTQTEKVLAYGSWIAVCLIWGTTYLAIRVAVRTLPDAWMAGVRFTVAGGVLLLILLLRGQKLPPVRQWQPLAIIGISLLGLGNWLVVVAEKTVPSGPTALMIAVTPFWIGILEWLFRKQILRTGNQTEAWRRSKVFGLILGFIGVGLLTLPNLQGTWSREYLFGVVIVQAACLFWAIGTVYSKCVKLDSGALMNASLEMLFGGLFLLVLAYLKGDFHAVNWNRESFIAFLYLIFFGGMVAFACFTYALSKLPSSLVSLYAYINPVIAVWLGWLILKEEVTSITILATFVILGGVWLTKGTRD